jgi:pyruvate/2-oxoglutarate dehydrogenase complex dihydrolipoamide dehydrogenase (E3) component
VGGRPTRLDIPGGELALSSDDLFSLATPPGKTLVVGASYVALECAGFLAGMGYDTTVMVRSILLRGFDLQCADMIGDHMEAHGAKFQRSRVPTRIERTEDGRLRVFSKGVSEGSGGAGGEAETSDVYDTVFTAVGRYADTAKLNLEAAGVVAGKDGKLVTVGEQTNVPHIYAIGDVVKGAPELTPVAIAAGKYLARRLYGKSTEGMDYDRIATTVFTPLEYGTVGLSEEAAKEKLGEDNVEIFHSFFTPLEYSIVEERPKNKCYAK